MRPSLQRLIDFQKLLLQFQSIDRALYLPNRDGRHENDTEHSYNLAMAGWFLAQYFPHLDRDLVIRIALVHDLVEIHAGDTFPFHNDHEVATKQQREAESLEKLAAEWEDFPDMTETLRAYEHRDSPEAKFVYALDKIMPPIVNLLEGGTAWKEHNVTYDDIHAVKHKKVAVSPEITAYYHQLMELLDQNRHLFGGHSDTSPIKTAKTSQ